MTDKVPIRQLPTKVTGLDQILGGGVPELSFNLIAGPPGSGKTTFAHAIMVALTGPRCKAVYFTVVGEPPLKMLRYQQQYEFFDVKRVVEVSDTGEGIPAHFLPHVFDRRAQVKDRRFAGLGLGLAIVTHIVELHGGSVAATSGGEGKGSTFSVRVPFAP
jgi:energy-coupling factor transporter ATP-binding protein EcfA2